LKTLMEQMEQESETPKILPLQMLKIKVH